jgi:hypothetical protein
MNRRFLLLLTVIFIGLAVFVAIQPELGRLPTTPTPNWREGFLFPEVTVRDIVTINLRDPNNGDTFTVSRAVNGTWTAPGSSGTLDTDAARLMAQAIVLLPYDQYLDSANTHLVEYGFNPNGILFIEFILQNGSQHVFAVGGLSENRENYSVIVDERPGVYLCPRGSLDFLIQMLLSPPLT